MAIPPRPANAMTGSQFIEYTKQFPKNQFGKLAYEELIKANIPNVLRKLVPVEVYTPNKVKITYYVMPDYLGIGSDADWIRVPLSPQVAQSIANAWGLSLITANMSQQIAAAATKKIDMQPLSAGATIDGKQYSGKAVVDKMMQDPRAFKAYDAKVEKSKGELTAGHYKDVVLPELSKGTSRVNIVGGQTKGKQIQPLSQIHENTYYDYSHGIRLASGLAKIEFNGVEKKVPLQSIISGKTDLTQLFGLEAQTAESVRKALTGKSTGLQYASYHPEDTSIQTAPAISSTNIPEVKLGPKPTYSWSPKSQTPGPENVATAPAGFESASASILTPEIIGLAKQMTTKPMGTVEIRPSNSGRWVILVTNSHLGPTKGNPERHWHRGVTVFSEKKGGGINPPPYQAPKPKPGTQQLLARINNKKAPNPTPQKTDNTEQVLQDLIKQIT